MEDRVTTSSLENPVCKEPQRGCPKKVNLQYSYSQKTLTPQVGPPIDPEWSGRLHCQVPPSLYVADSQSQCTAILG